jgi:hypothetical protein
MIATSIYSGGWLRRSTRGPMMMRVLFFIG